MTVRRFDQGAARAAAAALPATIDSDYRTRCRTLRVMAHTGGLAATFAFVADKARGEDASRAAAYRKIEVAIRQRLVERCLLDASATTPAEVLTAMGELPPGRYARASAEVSALLSWLARLATAMAEPTA